MKRAVSSARRRPFVECLESRSLLSTATAGSGPIANPDPASSIFVRFIASESASVQAADLASVHGSVVTAYPDGPELISLGRGITPAVAIQKLQADPGVVYASPNSTIHAASTPVYPNDPAFSQLWGLNNSNNVDINAPEAWGLTIGSPATIVAVIDTGIDLSNPDFAGKIWTNPGNDAASGYPNDTHGWNFIANTNNVQDDDGHGTHVSSIIAAEGNNGFGVVGVAPAVQIMPLKFLDANGNGTTSDAVSAIYFAVNHGAKVINASWGGVDYSGPLGDAIAFANAHNVVFVTAAGNDGTNNDVSPSYPASYQLPNELSVAAVDRSGNLPSFSNFGASTVNLAAPGVDIVSDVPTSIDSSGFETLSGTSMSAAYVSGVAALVAGINPNFTAAEIVQILDSTTKSLPSLAGKTITGGMVDAYNAVVDAQSIVASASSPVATAPSGSPPAAGIPALTVGASSVEQVQSSILASDEYFAVHGGTAEGFITGLYQNLLDRSPSAAEVQQWLAVYDSGTVTRYQIAMAIMTSPEARLTEVAQWFQDDLGRSASIDTLKVDPGVVAWANLIDEGFGDDTVQAAILSSPEYLIGHGGTPTSVVVGFYEDLNDRAPTSAELSAWSGLLYQGYAAFNVLRFFQGTSEVEQTKVAGWFVRDLGRTVSISQLKRDSGVQGWAAELGNF